jgi:hypothetical protein
VIKLVLRVIDRHHPSSLLQVSAHTTSRKSQPSSTFNALQSLQCSRFPPLRSSHLIATTACSCHLHIRNANKSTTKCEIAIACIAVMTRSISNKRSSTCVLIITIVEISLKDGNKEAWQVVNRTSTHCRPIGFTLPDCLGAHFMEKCGYKRNEIWVDT